MSLCGQRRLKSKCTDAQSELSLRWAHMSEGTFSHVVSLTLGFVVIYTYAKVCLA